MVWIGVAVTLALLGGVVWIAVVTGDKGSGDAPAAPTWQGPAPSEIALVVRRLVTERLAQAAGELAAVEELAQHHAFDMAVRNYSHEVDPEGVDLATRRARLARGFVGELTEWDHVVVPHGAKTAESLAEELLTGAGANGTELTALLASPRWNAVGVGVAAESKRCSLCLVFADHWATIEGGKIVEPPDAGWQVSGQLGGGVDAAEVEGVLLDDGGAEISRSQPTLVDPDGARPRAFTLVLAHPGDPRNLFLTMRRDGREGYWGPVD